MAENNKTVKLYTRDVVAALLPRVIRKNGTKRLMIAGIN